MVVWDVVGVVVVVGDIVGVVVVVAVVVPVDVREVVGVDRVHFLNVPSRWASTARFNIVATFLQSVATRK